MKESGVGPAAQVGEESCFSGFFGSVEEEPVHYIWACGGIPRIGTLGDWAKDFESSYYSGEQGPTTRVFTWDGETDHPIEHQVQVERGSVSENDYIFYMFKVNGEAAHVTIDGRA